MNLSDLPEKVTVYVLALAMPTSCATLVVFRTALRHEQRPIPQTRPRQTRLLQRLQIKTRCVFHNRLHFRSEASPAGRIHAVRHSQRSSSKLSPLTLLRRAVAKGNAFKSASAAKSETRPTKKFKAAAAPLGTALPSGYVDRARLRDEEEEDEKTAGIRERERKLQELAELAKRGKIDMEKVIEESRKLGGDISTTHLVRGLDFKLLEKVRQGENVMEGKKNEEREEELDEELDEALDKVVVKEKPEKPKKKTRAEVLAELKKAREEAEAVRAAEEAQNSRFRKIGDRKKEQETKKQEGDEPKIKYITTADGKVKRVRVKKKAPPPVEEIKPTGPTLGMEVPVAPPPPQEDSDSDIFEGVGVDYDPFDGLQDDDDSSDDSDDSTSSKKKVLKDKGKEKEKDTLSGQTSEPKKKIKLFDDDDEATEELPKTTSDLLASNPEIAAALRKAAHLAEKREELKTLEENSKESRLKKLLESADRDMDDMDMGFGGSTNFEDDDEEVAPASGGAKKRKRGKKNPKGDKNDIESIQKYAKV